jgi:HlyD family secretion protein
MKKLIITSITIIVLLVVGGVLAQTKLFSPKGNTAEISESEMQTVKVERGNISEEITASGTIEPLRIVEISSKASGKIIRMPVDKGDYLNEGDVIVEIEKTYAQNDVDQAEADLRSAKAKLEQAEIQIELERKQREVQLAQAEENLKEAKTRLSQLEKQLKLEKEANARKLLEAENNLKIAELQLRLLSPEVVRPEEVKRAEASVNQAFANLDLAQKEFDRKENLYEYDYISKSELDTAQTQLEAAKAQYDSAQQQLEMVKNPATKEDFELAEANVKKAEFAIQAAQENIKAEEYREEEIEMQRNKVALMESAVELANSNLKQIVVKEKELLTAQAAVSRSLSKLKDAEEKLEDTLVKAPISGTILEKNVEEGQVISSQLSSATTEGRPLITMADLTKIYVKTDVDETDIGKVKEGQSVKIKVDAFPNRVFDGEVLKIAPQGKVTQNVTTFEVTTELISKSDLLKPGMNAEVEIMATNAKDVILVPNEAIIERKGRKMVRVVGEEKPRSIETGASNYAKTEIISGLSEGEVVLIGGDPRSGEGEQNRFLERMKNDPSSSIRMMQ